MAYALRSEGSAAGSRPVARGCSRGRDAGGEESGARKESPLAAPESPWLAQVGVRALLMASRRTVDPHCRPPRAEDMGGSWGMGGHRPRSKEGGGGGLPRVNLLSSPLPYKATLHICSQST